MPQRPNILFIMSDNHPPDTLGCYGNPELYTPHLDRLAGQGLRFNNAFCVNAMCSPCRASVFTGLMPSAHGIHTWLDDRTMDAWPENWNALEEFTTLPERLQTAGYQTALIGKYHLGMPFQPQNGFHYWVTFPHGHTRDFHNNEIIDNGRRYPCTDHSVDFFTDKAVEYLQSRSPESGPFFLFLAYNGPYGHWPSIQGPPRNRFARMYETSPLHSFPREGISRDLIAHYELRKHRSGGGLDYTAHLRIPNDLPSLRNYASQMSMVDSGVGRVLNALRRAGLDETTLVVYTADHGFSLGHNGFWGHGQATWPANTHRAAFHVPLLVRHTGRISPNRRINRLVSQIDLHTTLLDYAGLNPEPSPRSPARNLVPLFHGQPPEWENAVFMEQEETRAIRTPDWLYMKRFSGSPGHPLQDALFNLRTDPREHHNCAANPNLAPIVQDLSGRIDRFFATHADPAWDLWNGGRVKSNSDKPWLWQNAWGETWSPTFTEP